MIPPWLSRLAASAVGLQLGLAIIGLWPAYSTAGVPEDDMAAATMAAMQVTQERQAEDRAAAQLAEEQAAARLAEEQAAAKRTEDERRAAETRASRTRTDPGSWACPVQGQRAFIDDFGDSRGRRRRHQGNDIMAPRGTPVVASVAGIVKPHHSGLGGISYYLEGEDGNTYFGTHLDRLSGASGRVAAGTVVGYVGSSGNASASAPHLHFEIHPGGGRAVNPFPMLSRHC